jgi:hypothetical protein
MPEIIHARLDAQTAALCTRLVKRLGWSESRIVREGIKALAVLVEGNGARKVIGQGRFRSGVADLGSNKKRLKGFGR